MHASGCLRPRQCGEIERRVERGKGWMVEGGYDEVNHVIDMLCIGISRQRVMVS